MIPHATLVCWTFVALAAVLLVQVARSGTWLAPLVAYRLQLPAGMTAQAATEFIAGLAGLSLPWWRRPFAVVGVVFETSATSGGITHHVLIPEVNVPFVLSALRAALPGANPRVDPDYRPAHPRLAVELASTSPLRSLAPNDKGAVSRSVLAALQPLREGEQIVVQWVVCPTPPRGVAGESEQSGTRSGLPWMLRRLFGSPELSRDEVRSLRTKQATPQFAATGRVVVVAPTRGTGRKLLVRLIAALHAANAPGVHLRQRWLPTRLVAHGFTSRRPAGVTYPSVLSAADLTGLIGLPIGDVQLPGLDLGTSRLLMPASDIPSVGLVLGDATFPGMERPIAVPKRDRLRHVHLVGPTGSGKSTVLESAVAQVIAAGEGGVLLDPKGDSAEDVLNSLPDEALERVVVVDPSDEERPVGLNPLAIRGAHRDLIVENFLQVLVGAFGSGIGARSDDVLRGGLATLVASPGHTLVDLPLLLTNEGFRRRLIAKIDDPIGVGAFWAGFDAMSSAEQAQVVAPLLNKIRAFVMRPRIRNVLGQAHPALDIGQALEEGKFLIVPLAKGVLGEGASALMGALIFLMVWQAVLRRVEIPAAKRAPITFFADEFQDFLRYSTSLPDILAQARGLGLSMVLAHQHLRQLSRELQEAVLANTRNRLVWQLPAQDAAVIAREMAPHVTAADLQNLGPYQVIATLSVNNRVTPPVSLATRPAPKPTGNAAAARQLSRERYGMPREEIEKALRARHSPLDADTSVGRREVTS